MYYTYLIKSQKDSSFYTGISENPQKRLEQHNSGKLKYTKRKRPWILWHVRKCTNTKEARIEEKYLKKKNREFKENLKNI